MQDEFDRTLAAATQLARRYRIIDDDDLREESPGVPRPVRFRAFDRLLNEGLIYRRRGRRGFDSALYAGCDEEHRSGTRLTASA